MKLYSHILTAALAAVCVAGAISAVNSSPLPFQVPTDKGIVEIEPISSDIFKVTTLPADSLLPFLESQSAIMSSVNPELRTFSDNDSLVILSESTRIVVERNSGKVSFFDNLGNLLLREAEGVNNDNFLKTVTLLGNKGENIYGAGERGHRLALGNDTLVMYNRQNYGYGEGDPRISQMGITVPWFSSDKGYGVLFDDFTSAVMTPGDTLIYTSETPYPLSYYFINGKGTLAGNTEKYADLTGHQDLPPFWALGYITSKYGYHNQAETLGAVDTLRRHGYPLDGLVLDLYWYGVETDMGRLEWDKQKWPDHKGMLDSLKSLGINVVNITQPYINKKGAIDNYNTLASQGMLTKDADGNVHDVTTWVGEAGMFDISNPDTRTWLWNRLRPLTSEGIAGWWGDLGEPEVHPLTIMHHNGLTAEQYHNVYGNEWSRLIYDGLRADFPETRPLLMMRGGTAGLQRYSVFPWTTDVARSWEGFGPQVKLMLNSGLSGLGYMSSDIGGFAVDPSAPLDPELYTRWLQMGVFTPVLRTHAQLQPEPFNFPEKEDILRRFIKMRYEWLPYNYTLAYENAAFGLPLARPLNFRGENPGDKFANITDEYLWGDEVLVAPVMKKGATGRKVLFPAGKWFDWYNPAVSYAGGKEYSVKAPLDRLPLFVKAGAFIPQYTLPLNNTSEYNPMFLTIKYFPSDSETSYTLYDDDRKSPTSLADNAFSLTTFRGKMNSKELEISFRENGDYSDKPSYRSFTFEIENVAKAPGKVVAEDGTELQEGVSLKSIRLYGWTYDAETRRLSIVVPNSFNGFKATF
ncbi:MAG: DUF5110 domain-containing protein [Muribaculaceae bacterium]|nr:DUF5110 domain-containing protein [Muribaculaceae bacterium]